MDFQEDVGAENFALASVAIGALLGIVLGSLIVLNHPWKTWMRGSQTMTGTISYCCASLAMILLTSCTFARILGYCLPVLGPLFAR